MRGGHLICASYRVLVFGLARTRNTRRPCIESTVKWILPASISSPICGPTERLDVGIGAPQVKPYLPLQHV